jgi:hypothetical protein
MLPWQTGIRSVVGGFVRICVLGGTNSITVIYIACEKSSKKFFTHCGLNRWEEDKKEVAAASSRRVACWTTGAKHESLPP